MKQMVYKEKRSKEVLDVGEYKGIRYCIISMGTHPCAYIDLPKENEKLYKIVDLMCHGGITYADDVLDLGFDMLKGHFVGWDYAHYGDYVCFKHVDFPKALKKWTTKEILNEIFLIINVIVEHETREFKKQNTQNIIKAIEKLADDLKRKAPLIASDVKDIEEIGISTKIRYKELIGWEIKKKYVGKDDNGMYIYLPMEEDFKDENENG